MWNVPSYTTLARASVAAGVGAPPEAHGYRREQALILIFFLMQPRETQQDARRCF